MKHLSFSSQRKWLVCSAICQPKSQALLTSWTLGVICTVYEEPLFLPQKCVKIHYEACLLFQLADGLHPQTKLLCRKMKSQKSVSVYYLRKIRVLLEMSIVNLNQKQNYKCFWANKNHSLFKGGPWQPLFHHVFFRRHYKSDSTHCMPSYTTTVTRYAKYYFPA